MANSLILNSTLLLRIRKNRFKKYFVVFLYKINCNSTKKTKNTVL